jgi:hypothetical protein
MCSVEDIMAKAEVPKTCTVTCFSAGEKNKCSASHMKIVKTQTKDENIADREESKQKTPSSSQNKAAKSRP